LFDSYSNKSVFITFSQLWSWTILSVVHGFYLKFISKHVWLKLLVNLFQSILQFDILNQLQENCLLFWEKELCNFANTIVMEWKAFRLRETYQSLFACWCCNLLDKVRSHSSLNRQKLLEIRRKNSSITKTIFCFIFFVQILVLLHWLC